MFEVASNENIWAAFLILARAYGAFRLEASWYISKFPVRVDLFIVKSGIVELRSADLAFSDYNKGEHVQETRYRSSRK